MTTPDQRSMPAWLAVALSLVILVGLWLRVALPGTTVFAADQARACALAEDIASGRWEAGGLVNSGGFRNPPGYVYILAAVWKISPDPMSLLRFTQLANLAAFAAAAWWANRLVGRTAALWGMAFFAAAPWAIHYCRWIFAQHLLFPAALAVYVSLWAWLVRGKRWAALGAILCLILLTEIHLAGVVLALAIGLVLIVWRPKLPVIPISIGALVGAVLLGAYLLSRQHAAGGPDEERIGILHVWRTIPAAAMSVSGIFWSLEFKEGYPLFAQSLGWQRWPLEIVMLAPVALLAIGLFVTGSGVRGLAPSPPYSGERAGERGLLRKVEKPLSPPLSPEYRGEGENARQGSFRTPAGLIVLLVLAIPLAFILAMIRTSPTYFPVWYPLPFLLIGIAATRLSARTPVALLLLAVLAIQLYFFTRQLTYIDRHDGVPKSVLGRSYVGLLEDRALAAAKVEADEVWVQYDGETPIMREAVPYVFRRGNWKPGSGRIALILYSPPWEGGSEVWHLAAREDVPEDAFLVWPWRGPAQRDARIPLTPGDVPREINPASLDTTGM